MILELSHEMLWLVSHTCSAKADFELLELETALQTCAKLTFCLIQIYFVGITAWYRSVGTRVSQKMSECPEGFQDNLDTTIIKNSPDWFRNSLNVQCTGLLQNLSQGNLESPSGELQSAKVGRLKQS